MTMAESEWGSSPAAFMRLKVSRHEMPASTRMRVRVLCTMAQLPRLPLASTESDMPMSSEHTRMTCGNGSDFLTIRDLWAEGRSHHRGTETPRKPFSFFFSL